MKVRTTTLSLMMVVAMCGSAGAQNAGQEERQPADETVGADAQPYVAETHGDWEVRCIEAADRPDPCQIYQEISDGNGGALAEVTLTTLPNGNAGISLLTPLETLLTENVRLTVDDNPPKVYPFTFCTAAGCFSRIGLTPEDIAAYKAGNEVTMRIVPARAANQEVTAAISLNGFTAAFNALSTER